MIEQLETERIEIFHISNLQITMEKYNYLDHIREDIREWLRENSELLNAENPREEIQEQIYDMLWTDDSVTGNGSGSYTFSTWDAEENLCHNLDLLAEALDEFGCNTAEALEKGAEYCDVTIRCYLLGQALDEVMQEKEFND